MPLIFLEVKFKSVAIHKRVLLLLDFPFFSHFSKHNNKTNIHACISVNRKERGCFFKLGTMYYIASIVCLYNTYLLAHNIVQSSSVF